MKRDLDLTLTAARQSGSGALPASNAATAFGALNINTNADAVEAIRGCIDGMVAFLADASKRVTINTCKMSRGALGGGNAGYITGSNPPEFEVGLNFLVCDEAAARTNWRLTMRRTTLVHELSHFVCKSQDHLDEALNAVSVYFVDGNTWGRFLTKEARRKFNNSKKLADAYRVYAQAVVRYGVFPNQGPALPAVNPDL
ncbi:hypothetical protein HK102_003940 [Quaeritorhiza haematococci]|nr:hypothetical protein HK102_003940 [Quaeritorhiza haematococci]